MPSDTQSDLVSKKKLWTGRILSALPVLLMLFGVGFSFAKPNDARLGFLKYGYPEGAFRPVLLTELACLALYVIPQTAVLGAIMLTGYLGGATATHVRAGEPVFIAPVIVGVVVWLGLFLREPRLRSLIPIRW